MNIKSANRRRLIALVVLVLAVPLTILMVRTVQEIRQRAAGGADASLSMPASLSVQLNQNVDVPITLNTDGAGIRGVDVVLNFDRTKLQVVSITPNAQAGTSLKTFAPVTSTGAFDTTRVVNDANTNGRIEFGAVTYDWAAQATTAAYNGTTTLATVRFQGVATGAVPVTFQFTSGSTTDTNIVLDSNPPQDLLTQASQLTNSTITVATATSPTATPTPGSTGTVTLQVSASSDDANQSASSLDLTGSELRVGNCGSTSCLTALRFTNVAIPKNATITSATLQFYSTQSQWQSYGFIYAAEGVANSQTFSAASTPSQRTLLPQTLTHSSDVQWNADTWYTMDNIASVIQAVVNQSGWTSGNSFSLILTGTAPTTFGSKFAGSYDRNPTLAPKLVVTYASSGSPSPTNTPVPPTATPTSSPTPTTPPNTPTPTTTQSYCGAEINGCINTFTGALRRTTGSCTTNDIAVSWGNGNLATPLINACVNSSTSEFRMSPAGTITCTSGEQAISWSQGNAGGTQRVSACVSSFTGGVRASTGSITCTSDETAVSWNRNISCPNSTTFDFTLKLHGIGNGGDSVNPNSTGNTSPLMPQRDVTVQVFDGSNTLVLSRDGVINYNTGTGIFNGTVDMGSTLVSGAYLVRVKSPKYLQRQVSGIKVVTAGQTHDMGTLDLIVGDVNNDNTLNILDYNLISDCYSDLAPPRACSDPAKKASTDITDDDSVNQFDYNLFIRELSVRSGE